MGNLLLELLLLLGKLLLLLFVILLFLKFNGDLLLLNEFFLYLLHLYFNKLLLLDLRLSELFKLRSKLLVHDLLSFLHNFLFIKLILVLLLLLLNFLFQRVGNFFALVQLPLEDGFINLLKLYLQFEIFVILDHFVQLNLRLILSLEL